MISIGIQTRELQYLPLDDMFEWLSFNNFREIEMIVNPNRHEWGDLKYFQDSVLEHIHNLLEYAQIDTSRSALRYSANMLEPCYVEDRYDYMRGVIDLAAKLGIQYVTGNLGSVPGADWNTNLVALEDHFLPILDYAKKRNIVIAIENCPHNQTNIAYSPKNWREILIETEDYDNFGIEFDPML